MRIAVVATGKIGLPLAVQYASMGHTVVGVDINPSVVDAINQGIAPFPGEEHLAEKLAEFVPKGLLTATTDYSTSIPKAEVIVVVVPLLVNEETWAPDFTVMDQATRSIAKHLSPGTLISYETTVPVGTTRNRLKPLIEKHSHMKEGEDFYLAFSPERVLTGRVFRDLRKYPKLVGGLSPKSSKLAVKFYEDVLEFDDRPDLERTNGVWDMGSPEAAEMAKLAETTYRDVNIGLANQFAVYADKAGIDIYKVIEACNSQPFSHIHMPGIAVGGHCIPVYPRLYLSTDPNADIVRTARKFNTTMPGFIISKIENQIGSLLGLSFVVMGASYRGGVKETAVSGVFPVVGELLKRGAHVKVYDPLYSDLEIEGLGFIPYKAGSAVDIVIFQADHKEFLELSVDDFPDLKLVADGRNFIDSSKWGDVPILWIGKT